MTMVRTSPAPTRASLEVVRSELMRTTPVSMIFWASVRDLTAREKNSQRSSRCLPSAMADPTAHSGLRLRSAASAANGESGSKAGSGLRGRVS